MMFDRKPGFGWTVGALLAALAGASGSAVAQTQRLPTPPARPQTPAPAPSLTIVPQQMIPSSRSSPSPAPLSSNSVKGELDQIFSDLTNGLKGTDDLVARLRAAKERKPEDAERDVDQAADVLGQLVDKLKPEGSLHAELDAVRTAAKANRQRVADMDKTILEETDRNRILQSWDDIMRKSDTAGTAMETMRSSLTTALSRLRMRRTAIAEMRLTEDYQAAIDSFNAWLQDLQQTTGNLHNALQTPGT